MHYRRGFPINHVPSEEDLIDPTNIQELIEAYEVLDSLEMQMSKFEPDSNHPCFYLYPRQKKYLSDYLNSIGEYDNAVLIRNINYLAKKNGIRIGDVEKLLGISAGYISRTARENSGKKMSIDNVWRIARLFGIELGTLLEFKLDDINCNNDMIIKFLSKLCHQTQDDKITWVNSGGYSRKLDRTLGELECFKKETSHAPVLYFNEDSMNVSDNSLFDCHYVLNEDVYSCFDLDAKKELIIISYNLSIPGDDDYFYDLFFRERINGKSKMYKVFSTFDAQFMSMYDLVTKLIEAIKGQQSRAYMSDEVKNIISNFLN